MQCVRCSTLSFCTVLTGWTEYTTFSHLRVNTPHPLIHSNIRCLVQKYVIWKSPSLSTFIVSFYPTSAWNVNETNFFPFITSQICLALHLQQLIYGNVDCIYVANGSSPAWCGYQWRYFQFFLFNWDFCSVSVWHLNVTLLFLHTQIQHHAAPPTPAEPYTDTLNNHSLSPIDFSFHFSLNFISVSASVSRWFLIRILKIHSEKFTETAVIWTNFPWFAWELARSPGVVFARFSKHLMPISCDGNSFLKSVPTYLPEISCSSPLRYVWSPSLSELLLLLLG